MHIPGRTNPADFLSRKRFPDGPGPASHTGYDEPDSALELFTAAGAAPATAFVTVGAAEESPRFLHADFAAAIRAALPSDTVLGPLLAAAQPHPSDPVDAAGAPRPVTRAVRSNFVCRDGLLYRCSSRGDRLCVPAAGGLRAQVLGELHATPLGGHFGRDKALALARRSVWRPGLSAEVEEYVRTCRTCQRVKADHLPPAGLLFSLPVPTRRGGCIGLDFGPSPAVWRVVLLDSDGRMEQRPSRRCPAAGARRPRAAWPFWPRSWTAGPGIPAPLPDHLPVAIARCPGRGRLAVAGVALRRILLGSRRACICPVPQPPVQSQTAVTCPVCRPVQ